jgi:hypothetical protein
VIVHPARFPQGPATIGALISAIDQLVNTPSKYPAFVHWLSP